MNNYEDIDKLKNEIEKLKKQLNEKEEQLTESKKQVEFLLTAINNMPNPVFIKNDKAEFVYFNKKYEEAFGISRTDYFGKTVLDLEYLPHKAREKYQKEDVDLIKSGGICSYNCDFRFDDEQIHPSFYWSKGFCAEKTNERGLIGEIVDISKERYLQKKLDEYILKLKKYNMELEIRSETDAGTGLYNRGKLNKILVEQNKGSCILMADIDHFKQVNDVYGHLKGDEILKSFSEIIKLSLKIGDTAVRYGGEEFLIIVKDSNIESAYDFAEIIRKKTEANLHLPNGEKVTVSIGVANIDLELNLEKNIQKADNALYKAKQNGRNQTIIYDPESVH